MKKQHLVLALCLAATGGAFAQAAPGDSTPRIDQRAANQQKRIDQGVASGQLTPREAQHLERRESHIAREESRAKSDGVVTARERRRLVRHQDAASRAIHRQKHDAQHS
ncbi:MAG: hypothetical protein KGL68_10035 [Burkholderiales bacterium]|nr:hypothetical protein [Burkholderiales bacterium]